MSQGSDTIGTMNCYKCEEPLGYDPEDNVHPLCDECQDDFMSWFENELARLG